MTIATFRKGRHLSRQHKAKISRALRGRGRKKPTLEGHVVKGAKIGAGLGGGLGVIGGTLVGGALGGPVGAVAGGLGNGALYGLGGGVSGAGYGAALYGARRAISRRRGRFNSGIGLTTFSEGDSMQIYMMGDLVDAEFARRGRRGRRKRATARGHLRKGRNYGALAGGLTAAAIGGLAGAKAGKAASGRAGMIAGGLGAAGLMGGLGAAGGALGGAGLGAAVYGGRQVYKKRRRIAGKLY